MGESSGDSGNHLKLIVNIFFTSSMIRFLFFYILDVWDVFFQSLKMYQSVVLQVFVFFFFVVVAQDHNYALNLC
jgi:hypothetical protein